jgi:integrase
MAKRRAPYWDAALKLWVAEVHLGRDGRGKRLRKRVSSKSQATCLKKLEKLERELEAGTVLAHAPEKITIEAWLWRWLEEKRSGLGVNTIEDYRSKIRNHLAPRIGSVLLHKLTPLHCAKLFTEMEKAGVGRRTQQIVHVVIKQALERAVELELLAKSPLKVSKPVPDPEQQREKPTWTIEDVHRFLVHASTHRLAALFVLAVATGMRQSEIFGLMREHLHVEQGFLKVEWALHEISEEEQARRKVDPRLGNCLHLARPKTKGSRRIIALPRTVVAALREHLSRAPASLFVFATEAGEPIRARAFQDWWQALLEHAGVPYLPFKQLRHTCLTLLAEKGVPVKAVQALAGHSTPDLTLKIYTQATAKLARQAADAWDELLEPGAFGGAP